MEKEVLSSTVYSKEKILHHPQKVQSLLEGRVTPPIYVRVKPTNVCNHGCFYCTYADRISKENLIIVEGKKDLNSLIYIGFSKKNIFILNNGEPFLENVEKINEIIEDKKCKMSILTDLDKKGKLLYSQIKKEIIDKKRIDESFRSLLLMQKISHVEGLSSYVGLD